MNDRRAIRTLRLAARAEAVAGAALATTCAWGIVASFRPGLHWADHALACTAAAVGAAGIVLLGASRLVRLRRPDAAHVRVRAARRRLALLAGGCLALVPLVVAEVGARALERAAPSDPVIDQGHSEELYEHDPLLGYGPRRPLRVRAWKKADERTIYDVTYTIDAEGRRVVPASAAPGVGDGPVVVFLGCSNTFGEGVQDDETMANQLALASGGRAEVYNYGFCGYGPQQMLARIERGDLDGVVAGRPVIAIYSFIDAHVNRAVGSMGIVTAWGVDMPCYELDDGWPRLQGSFREARPARNVGYALVSRSSALRRLGVDLPRLREPHYELCARLVEASARRLALKATRVDFYTTYLPGMTRGLALTPHLERTGARVLDYSALLPDDARWRFDHDHHMTPAAHAELGRRLHDAVLGRSPAGSSTAAALRPW